MAFQILMLENAHADGVAVLTVDEKLMFKHAFDLEAELGVDVDRFFVLLIDNQVELVEFSTEKP